MEAKTNGLSSHLQDHLRWHKARIKFLDLLIISLIRNRSVNFCKNATSLSNRAPGSNLRRIQRFFAGFAFDFDAIARLLMSLMPFQGPYQLSLDRTNWKFAGVNFNILCLAVVADGVALPVLWSMLGKQGNSDQQERRKLIARYIDLFGVHTIDYIMADREFVGEKWFKFLILHPLRFYIRIRANMTVSHRGRAVKAFWLFNDLPLNMARQLEKPVMVKGNWVYLTGMRVINRKGQTEFVIVATYQADSQTMQVYARRWAIECFFKAIKSAGFHIEDTHLTDHKRLEKLFAVVAIAFLWVYLVGQYQNERKPIRVLAHKRRAQSVFRYGFDSLFTAILFDYQSLEIFVNLLSCT